MLPIGVVGGTHPTPQFGDEPQEPSPTRHEVERVACLHPTRELPLQFGVDPPDAITDVIDQVVRESPGADLLVRPVADARPPLPELFDGVLEHPVSVRGSGG